MPEGEADNKQPVAGAGFITAVAGGAVAVVAVVAVVPTLGWVAGAVLAAPVALML